MMDLKKIELELFAQQSEIIQTYSSVTNKLIHLLRLHKVDESEYADVKEKIDEVIRIRAETGL